MEIFSSGGGGGKELTNTSQEWKLQGAESLKQKCPSWGYGYSLELHVKTADTFYYLSLNFPFGYTGEKGMAFSL